MMTQEEAMKMVQDIMTNIYPEMNLSEGSLCYDLISPLAYILQGYQMSMEETFSQYRIENASMETLEYMASDRIGTHREATATILRIQSEDGEEIMGNQWHPVNYPNLLFHRIDGEEGSRISIQSEVLGKIPFLFSNHTRFQNENSNYAILVEVFSYGQNEETIEQYRQRYLSSILLDQQAGTGPYYKQKMEEHPLIGYAYVDYATSTPAVVHLIAINGNYGTLNAGEVEVVMDDMKKFIPIGQSLQLTTILEEQVVITIQFQNPSIVDESMKQNLKTVIQRWVQEVLLFQLFSSENLYYIWNYLDFVYHVQQQFSERGILDILIDGKRENRPVDRLIPYLTFVFKGE